MSKMYKMSDMFHTSDLNLDDASSSVPFFSLKGHKCKAKVVHIYDGDTVHLVFEMFGKLYKWHIRIAHIDTPELRTKNTKEKDLGYIVKHHLQEMIGDKIVDIVCLDFDKYGRLLAEITFKGLRIDQWMIENGYAHPYEGKTKMVW